MVKGTLVRPELLEEGAQLLSKLDDHGEHVDAMFWVYLLEEEYWRLYVGLRDSSNDRLAAYDRLLQVLRNSDFSWRLDSSDISIFDPQTDSRRPPLANVFASTSHRSPVPGRSWAEFDDAVVYRWNDQHLTAKIEPVLNGAELASRWEEARQPALLNRPRLLFHVKDGLVTIRIHPVHGPDIGLREGELEEIKKAFVLDASHMGIEVL